MVVFVTNCLVKMTLRLFLANFCCYDYSADASEAVQKIKDTGVACQLTKTANFIATYLGKNIFSSLLPACWRYKTKIKISKQQIYLLKYLLYIGLMLIISNMFSILCLLCLCGNREYPGSFQNKAVSSKLFF